MKKEYVLHIRGVNRELLQRFKHQIAAHSDGKLKNREGKSYIAMELNRLIEEYLERTRAHTQARGRSKFEKMAEEIREMKAEQLNREAESKGAYAANYLAVIPRILAKVYGSDERTIEKYSVLLYSEGVLAASEMHTVIHNSKVFFSKEYIEREAKSDLRELKKRETDAMYR